MRSAVGIHGRDSSDRRHHPPSRHRVSPRPAATIPAHRLVPVLTFHMGAPTLPSKGNAKGLRLAATDVDWTAGDDPEVTGPGKALLMAAAGRVQALDDLSGDGLPTLQKRIHRCLRLCRKHRPSSEAESGRFG